MPRPNLRPIFVDSLRRPRVTFFTSSSAKFLQARLVFGRFGLDLRHHQLADDPYSEDYSGTKDQLLEQAIHEIRARPHSGTGGSYFFIEDTSIRIEALSSSSEDVPGLAAKEWFAETTHEELSAQVHSRGDNRAVVRSDIALWVPRIGRIPFFRGETEGTIASEPPRFVEDPHYPWLSSDNFSAWLIPNGSKLRLSEMSFEESWDYDFRVKALCQLVERLEEYAVALNPPTTLFRRRSRSTSGEPALFDAGRPTLAVVGPTCSGKTTFGDHAEAQSARVIDASSVVRMLAEKWTGAPIDATEFASKLLAEHGADVVSRQIVEMLDDSPDWHGGTIVTGLRTIEEIEYLKSAHPDLLIVSIEATQRLRYERYLRRNTRTHVRTYKDFQKRDALQRKLGLLEVVEDIADIRVQNYESIEEFSTQVSSTLEWSHSKAESALLGTVGVRSVDVENETGASQFIRCLDALSASKGPVTASGLSKLTGIRQNNVSKTLRSRPATVDRIEENGRMLRYQIRPSGESLLRVLGKSTRTSN